MSPQHLEALEEAKAVIRCRVNERDSLINAPLHRMVPALVNPSHALGSYTLHNLFAGRKHLFLGINKATLARILAQLNKEGWRYWHPEIKLGELTLRERRRLIKEVVRAAESPFAQAHAVHNSERKAA